MKVQIYNKNVSAFLKYFTSEKAETLIFFQKNVVGNNRSKKMQKNVNFRLVTELVTVKHV